MDPSEGEEAPRRARELEAEGLAFAGEVQSLQRRLAEVRKQRARPAAASPRSESVPSPVPRRGQLERTAPGESSSLLEASPVSKLDWLQRERSSSGVLGLEALELEDPRGDRSLLMEELRSENNFLTERLVEASLESAQSLESFSCGRAALWRLVQELRRRLQSEQAAHAQTRALLEAALAERKRPEAAELPQQQMERLQRQADARAAEAQELRAFVWQAAEQANATILDLARKNLELERALSQAKEQPPTAAPKPEAPPATRPRCLAPKARRPECPRPGGEARRLERALGQASAELQRAQSQALFAAR